MTKLELAEALTPLGIACNREIDAALVSAYHSALDGELPDELIRRSVFVCIRTCKFFPTPAEMIEKSGVMVASAKDRAAIAFKECCRLSESVGSYRSVWFEDPCAAAAVEEMGGWATFCLRDDDLKWIFKEFCEGYERACRLGVASEQPRLLAGQHGEERPAGTVRLLAASTGRKLLS